MMKKPRRDVPFEFKAVAIATGYQFLDKIIWVKGDETNVHTSGGWGGGGCGWGTYCSPSGPSIRCASEPILIFSKGSRGRKVVSGEGHGQCVRGDIKKEEWLEWTKDVWFVRGKSSRQHPAIFPEAIPLRLVKLYTYPGETVLDPFVGIGTTCQAALSLDRDAIGIEIEPTYVEIAKQRIDSHPVDAEYAVAV
jgi:site-specific DNA-methyltransferase (adenine-specific)